MAQTKARLLERLLASGVVAVIRTDSIEPLAELARALLDGGVICIELTMTTPHALAGIEMLCDRFGGEALVGVGTVLDAATCRDAIAAGAQYVISPHFDPAVVDETRRHERLSIPGAFTPTEILRAWAGGADVVKVFPSAGLGPGYLRDVLAPLPNLRLMPTGGVDPTNVGQWINAGAACVGAGASLVPKAALAGKDWAAITATAKAFVEAIRRARESSNQTRGVARPVYTIPKNETPSM